MHLAEVMLKGQVRRSEYTLLVEDDMVWCSADGSAGAAGSDDAGGAEVLKRKKNALDLIWEAIDHANTHAASSSSGGGGGGVGWTGVRLGYGGNGLILPSSDLPAASDYMLANMHRKPPDWLLTEWYVAHTGY
jgi:hypothetical protein